MEIIKYEKNDINDIINNLDLVFNGYLNNIKNKSQLSSKEYEMIINYYKSLLIQLKNLLGILNSANISLQQIEYGTIQEKKVLDELYNNITLNSNNNSPLLEVICKIMNELNSLSNLPTTTISEIQQKYFYLNNHFMNANYFVNNQGQIKKYKKGEKKS